MLTTKTGNVSAPLLMNVDDRMGSCRDKGWIWGRVGALCLSLVATRSSGDCVEQTGRTPTRTSTRPPHPLHPAPCPYRTRDAPFSIRLSNIIRTLGTQAFRWCNYPIRLSPFCRDKGWIWGRVGALCLSLVATRSSGDCVEQTGRTPTRTSTRPPHPLHPAPCPYRTRDAPFSIRLSNIIRTLGTQAFRWCNYPIRLSPFCRDKGWIWGRVGAWCLSWWQRDPVGISWSKQVAPQPGQAPGPLIHSTPPLVPTGRGTQASQWI